MRLKELAQVTEGSLYIEGFSIPVKILDLRSRFGTIDFLVTPVNGDGQKWVSSERVITNEG